MKSYFSKFFIGWMIGFFTAGFGMVIYSYDVLIYYTVFVPLAIGWAIMGGYWK